MKRFVTVILATIMVTFCAIPSQAETIHVLSEDEYIYVDYETFHGNREYYDTLMMKGYAICVYVGEEHAAEEKARRDNISSIEHDLIQSTCTKGTSVPTEEYDVHQNAQYEFVCNANYDFLYTNVKFYGCTAYMIDGYNEDSYSKLRIRVYGTSKGTIDYSVPPLSAIYKVVGTNRASDRFFVGFFAPSHARGQIYCIGH